MSSLDALQDFVDQRGGNAKLLGDVGGFVAIRAKRYNTGDLSIGQLGKWVQLATRSGSPVSVLSASIFGSSDPFKIFGRVVAPVAVDVVNCRVVKRRAVERFADEAMDVIPRGAKADFSVALDDLAFDNFQHDNAAAARPDVGSHTPKAGSLNVRQSAYGLPNFARKCINFISHSAVPSREWLGPRGVTSTVSGPFFLAKSEIPSKGDGYALSVN